MHGTHLNAMDLNLLKSLGALLTHSSVTKAGQELNLTQPAMSRSLARLRDLFDDPLLVRSGRTMLLTPLAEDLRQPVLAILRSVADLIEPRIFDPATSTLTVRINAPEGLTMLLLMTAIGPITAQAPGLDFVFTHHPQSGLESMATGGVDLVVDVVDEVPAGFSSQPLFHDPLVCVLRTGHPILPGKLTVKNFDRWPHVMLAAPGRESVEQDLVDAGFRCRHILTVSNFISAASFAAESDALLVLPRHLARSVCNSFDLQILELPVLMPEGNVQLVWHQRVEQEPSQIWLREQISSLIGSDAAATQLL